MGEVAQVGVASSYIHFSVDPERDQITVKRARRTVNKPLMGLALHYKVPYPCLWAVEMGWLNMNTACPVSLDDFGRVKNLNLLLRDARDC